jgi:riboflavin kinase/FMN adenylyltransferase
MTGVGHGELRGVANVGTRPTVTGNATVILEVHLFDFHHEIYGHYVEVHFKHKIRDEMRFESVAQLKSQIEQDVIAAKRFFA